MIIVPLIFTSIIIGISSIKERSKIGRLGIKTFLYYVGTSLFAIIIGLILANLIQPGIGAATIDQAGAFDTSKLNTSSSILDILTFSSSINNSKKSSTICEAMFFEKPRFWWILI